jgi:molecular chaperone Hsp33
MPDHLVRGLVEDRGLRVVYARVTDTARIARMLHGLYPTSAWLFAEALAAGALLGGALEKEKSRVNLQIQCDGPVGGLFVDAHTDGDLRGYVKRPGVNFPGEPRHGARAALGGSGFLAVLRDMGEGNIYRGAVELERLEVAGDLRRYFDVSEQVGTALDVQIAVHPEEPLGEVGGLLVQRLPDGDGDALEQARRRIAAGVFQRALARGAAPHDAIDEVAGPGFELLARLEVSYRCSCTLARARAAVSALGREGIEEVLANEKQAVITCEFCRQRYVVTEEELRDMARRLAEREGTA